MAMQGTAFILGLVLFTITLPVVVQYAENRHAHAPLQLERINR
ncbi:hypothetical protein [Rhizobium sp. CSW-27]|nr:hypothetical protein [Rhizobium sp. CSW-27]